MSEVKRIGSVDLDGVAFKSWSGIQAEGIAAWAQPWSYNKSYMPELVRSTFVRFNDGEQTPLREDPLKSHGEKISLWVHSRRSVDHRISELLRRENFDSVVGNTGRPDKRSWVDMTMEGLAAGGFAGIFDGVYFKPKGASSEDTKYSVLYRMLQEGQVTHYDDNAQTVKRLAPLLPEVKFVIVQDLTSSVLFSKAEMIKHPNVTRVALKSFR